MKYISFDDAVRATYYKTKRADHIEIPGVSRYEYTKHQILDSIRESRRLGRCAKKMKLDLYEKLTEWPHKDKIELVDHRRRKAIYSLSTLANGGDKLYLKKRQFKKWLKKQHNLEDIERNFVNIVKLQSATSYIEDKNIFSNVIKKIFKLMNKIRLFFNHHGSYFHGK